MTLQVVVLAPAHPFCRRLNQRAPMFVVTLARRLVAAFCQVPVIATNPDSLLHAHFRVGLLALSLAARTARALASMKFRPE